MSEIKVTVRFDEEDEHLYHWMLDEVSIRKKARQPGASMQALIIEALTTSKPGKVE